MRMAMTALEKPVPGDLIFASGVTWQGREFVEELFRRYGLDYHRHIDTLEDAPVDLFSVDVSKTKSLLAYNPEQDIFDVCASLIEKGGP